MTGLLGAPRVSVHGDRVHVAGAWLCLTKDEAIHLANQLTDAVDELELAEAVSGE